MRRLSSRLTYAATAGLVVLGAVRIVSTYPIFSQTVDEPSHIAGGLEWLDRGTYWFEPKHPPLARIALATGPYLAGLRLSDSMPLGRVHMGRVFREGNALLETGPGYDRNLTLARLGNLLFFVLGCFAVFWLAVPRFGRAAAVAAVAFASGSPMILAHGGVATTDMGFAATLTLALVALLRFLEQPGQRRALLLGAAIALPLVTKLSAVLFLPLAFAITLGLVLLGRQSAQSLRSVRPVYLALVVLAAVTVMWAVYRFSLGTLLDVDQRISERGGPFAALAGMSHIRAIPAVEWFAGVKDLLADNAEGRKGYLLGSVFLGGNPLYFPVGLLLKTPIPLLILELSGIGMAFNTARRSRNWTLLAPAAAAAAILLSTIPTQINIGMRHILPVFLLLIPYAGLAISWLFTAQAKQGARVAGGGLLLWLVWSTARVHPDYLAYFNELALLSAKPALVNSDLDWGQDAKRLVKRVRELRIDSLHVGYFGSTDLAKRGLQHFDTLSDYKPVTGWVAVSINRLMLGRALEPASDQFSWLAFRRPYTTIGRSILLYQIPPD